MNAEIFHSHRYNSEIAGNQQIFQIVETFLRAREKERKREGERESIFRNSGHSTHPTAWCKSAIEQRSENNLEKSILPLF